MSNVATSNKWKVKPPSREYKYLPSELRGPIDAHLSEYPVKLGAIAKDLGVKVLLSTLPRGISGQIRKENGDFVIRINRHETKHRQRFTLAHELAHFLLHRDRIEETGGWSENILLRAPGQPLEIEYEANRLASDLVIPSEQLDEATADYTGPMTEEIVEYLAGRFRVSKVAMEIKLQIS